ncbi:unnamed protein product [Owenia fusiformis]|uniref:Uncharacterized protein n=1 Tax=Owenia fusiformis TaxID=6347 RepID=A0A8J1XRZ8_OWEFU|nr:unnamed protein product [Owenia fusiformis]
MPYQGDVKSRLAGLKQKRTPVTQVAAPNTESIGVTDRASAFQERVNKHQQSQEINPFSEQYKGLGATYKDINDKYDDRYGKPEEGSKTEFRGKSANERITGEVIELCNIIHNLGKSNPDGTYSVKFGVLFEFYTKISNKLVGMLMRAKKQGLVYFDREMLWQRRDDDVDIHLIRLPQSTGMGTDEYEIGKMPTL